MQALTYSLVPLAAVVIGSIFAVLRPPGERLTAGVQHLAAGVVFAAAAVEILPKIVHQASPVATITGGALGVGVMLGIKAFEGRAKGPLAMMGAIATDLLIDGLVLGLAFIAGAKAGLLLALALTLEVLFLGVTVSAELGETLRSRVKIIAVTTGLGLMLPVGVLLSAPVATLSPVIVAAFLSFGLMALLYLVTEELLVEAHERPDSLLISAMFFVGFLALLVLEELLG